MRGVFQSLEERLWRRVDKTGECWIWTGTTNPSGYGSITDSRTKKPHMAHRLSWELANGRIPDGLVVCHRCDNPPCVNPAHLFIGTKGDNNRDCFAKGRNRQPVLNGEDNPSAKLTRADVAEIRRLLAAGRSKRSLAKQFPVCRSTITKIAGGRIWADVEVDR